MYANYVSSRALAHIGPKRRYKTVPKPFYPFHYVIVISEFRRVQIPGARATFYSLNDGRYQEV